MKKKTFCIRMLQTIGFLALLLIALYFFRKVFFFKSSDGIFNMTKFYEQEENTVDVLVLGSSHAYTGISTAELWDSYGIAAYVLGGSEQTMWNSYYYLEEALKTQTPKLIVLEGYMTTYAEDYQSTARIICNTYGMKWSNTKKEAIEASVPEDERMAYYLEYMQYHARYSELTATDFLDNMGDSKYENWKGYVCNTVIMGVGGIDNTAVAERKTMSAKSETYFRKIMTLAKEHDIPVCVVITPYTTLSLEDKQIYNTVSDICKEYNAGFVNYNVDVLELNLDTALDFSDEVHLNDTGSEKLSKVFGAYIKENYEIPDRRDDEKWITWEQDARYVERIQENKAFTKNVTVTEALAAAEERNYTLFVSASKAVTDEVKSLLAELDGVECEELRYMQMMCYQDGKISYMNADNDMDTHALEFDRETVVFKKETDAEGQMVNKVYVDGNCIEKIQDGYNVIVYDEVTESVVDIFGIWSKSPEECIRSF